MSWSVDGSRVAGRPARHGKARSGRRGRPLLWALAALLLLVLGILPACASAAGSPSDFAHCAPVALSTAAPASTAATTPSPAPLVLYQANWAQGLSSWQASPGWSVVNGALRSDTEQGLALTVPYLPATTDYQVEISVQILSIPRTGGQFALRTAPQGCDAGFDAGVLGLRVGSYRPNGDHPLSIIYLDPQGAQDTQGSRNNTHDYEPGPDARTYRVVVQGPQATLYVDDHFFGSASSGYSHQLAHSPIRLMCSGVAIQVTTLRILSL